jgi:hypothetical protein
MTSPHDRPTLDDVMETEESAPRDRQQHGKAHPRPNDEALQHRTELERQAVGLGGRRPRRRRGTGCYRLTRPVPGPAT